MKPLQHAVYKGTGGKFGAVQFNLQIPHHYKGKEKSFNEKDSNGESIFTLTDGRWQLKEGWKVREGAVFVEMTSAKGANVYDWPNKIIMALSVSDIGKVILALSKAGETSLMHDPGAKTQSAGEIKKWFKILTSEKGAMLMMSMSVGNDTRSHSVPLSPDEVVVLRQLLQGVIPRALNW